MTTETAANPAQNSQGTRGEVVINVRFQPNGLVNSITHKPENLSAQDWFDRLCRVTSGCFMPLSGGRGAFRIDGADFQLILEANAA